MQHTEDVFSNLVVYSSLLEFVRPRWLTAYVAETEQLVFMSPQHPFSLAAVLEQIGTGLEKDQNDDHAKRFLGEVGGESPNKDHTKQRHEPGRRFDQQRDRAAAFVLSVAEILGPVRIDVGDNEANGDENHGKWTRRLDL